VIINKSLHLIKKIFIGRIEQSCEFVDRDCHFLIRNYWDVEISIADIALIPWIFFYCLLNYGWG
jgi:hypothetical protein